MVRDYRYVKSGLPMRYIAKNEAPYPQVRGPHPAQRGHSSALGCLNVLAGSIPQRVCLAGRPKPNKCDMEGSKEKSDWQVES